MFQIARILPNLVTPVLAIALLAISNLTLRAQPNSQEIQWFDNLSTAVQYANTNSLPLMLHFYGDNCPPCKLLERKAFKDRDLVGKLNSQVVAVRINGEKDRELRSRYSITRWPTDVFLLPNGQEIYRTTSPQDPSVYGKLIDRIALRHRDWNIEQVANANAAERKLQNQTRTQLAYSTPNNSYTMASSGSHPTVTHSRHSPMHAQQAEQTSSAYAPNAYTESFPVGPSSTHDAQPAYARTATLSQPSDQTAASGLPQIISGSNTNAPAPKTVFPVASVPTSTHAPTTIQNHLLDEPTVPALNSPTLNSTAFNVALPAGTPSVPVSMVSNQRELPTDRPAFDPTSNNPQSTGNHPIHSVQNPFPQSHAAPIAEPTNQAANRGSTPPQETSVGLDGFCPVSLYLGVKGETDPATCWTEGSPKFAVKHRGRIYLCASEELRQRFLKGPDLYAPCLSGFDLIHFIRTQEYIDGKCEFGCFQGDTGRIFLFANQENCNEFRQQEAYYSKLVSGGNQPERVASQPDLTPVR